MSKNIKLSAPWVTYFRKIEALFSPDPDVDVKFDEDKHVITLFVKGDDKADAITELLPFQKEFGNVTVTIKVVPANTEEYTTADLYNLAFKGSPVLSFIETIDGVFSNNVNYVVFANKVVQFFNDNMGDIHGLTSTLYQDIAKEIFGTRKDVFFCTDVDDELEEK